MHSFRCFFAYMLCLSSMVAPAFGQQKLTVFSDGPLRAALEPIAAAFRQSGGPEVELVFGLSPVIAKKISDGEKADVVIIQPDILDELTRAGKLPVAGRALVARVGIGLAVRADAPVPDIGDATKLRQALLDADTLVFNNVASGNYFASVLDRLGIADSVKAKVVRLPPAAVFERVKSGVGRDIAVGTVPLITADKGLRLAGALPAEMQNYIDYAAAPMSASASSEGAAAFTAFLRSSTARTLFLSSGIQPVPAQ